MPAAYISPIAADPRPPGSPHTVTGHRSCPLCGNADCVNRGEILHPEPAFVAGMPLALQGCKFSLLACGRCGFEFKSPAIPDEKLLQCYAASSEYFSGWVVDPHNRRFDTIREMLLRHCGSPGRILDIGCFHASFLNYLGTQWKRFGVEPSQGASRVAEQKGVSILAATLDALPADTPPFDVITAMDLIEHLNEPMPFFRLVHQKLKPGGLVLLLSGDVEAWPSRLMSNLYWYCSLPEHCAFFSRESLEYICSMVGFELVEYRRLCHSRATLWHKTKDLIKNFGYLAVRRLGGLRIGRLRRAIDRCGPGWLSASDHFYVILKKR